VQLSRIHSGVDGILERWVQIFPEHYPCTEMQIGNTTLPMTNSGDDFEVVTDKQALQTYISRRQEDLRILSESLEAGSVDTFNKIGHRILGSARTFGFPDLEAIAQKMDQLKNKDLPEAGSAILTEFSKWIDSTKSKFE
jgi:HPt (histidine-containing phosphotransfer) domain-containing protein